MEWHGGDCFRYNTRQVGIPNLVRIGRADNSHGLHSVILDDSPISSIIDTYTLEDVFNTPIYQIQGLTMGVHKLQMKNEVNKSHAGRNRG